MLMTSQQASDWHTAAMDELEEHFFSDIRAVGGLEYQHASGWAEYAAHIQICQREARARDKATGAGLVSDMFERVVLRQEAEELQVT